MNDKCACMCGTIYDIKFNFCPNCGRKTVDNIQESEDNDVEDIKQKDEVHSVEVGFEYDISNIKNDDGIDKLLHDNTINQNKDANVKTKQEANNNSLRETNSNELAYKAILKIEKRVKLAVAASCIFTIVLYIALH